MENENKQIKASKWALAILFILSAVVLVLFFGVGYGNQTYLNNKVYRSVADMALCPRWHLRPVSTRFRYRGRYQES